MKGHILLITPHVAWMMTTSVAEVQAHIIKVSSLVVIPRPCINVFQSPEEKDPA